MLTKFTHKLLTRSFALKFPFTNSSQKLQNLLQKIEVETEGGKPSALLDSGLIVGQHIDP